MPLDNYAVWIGHPINYETVDRGSSPHIHLWSDEDPNAGKGSFQAAINIKSSTKAESRLVYWFIRDFKHPITDTVSSLPLGLNPISSQGFPALDYIRGNFLNLESGTLLKHNVPGESNDILDFITPVLDEAIQRKATIYLYGEPFPGGIHDVHMNQGNAGSFEKYNGTWQDGGVLLHFDDDDHWEGIFLAFAVQSIHTDDNTGNPIGDVSFAGLLEGSGDGSGGPVAPISTAQIPSAPIPGPTTVQIRAALVNPVGPDVSTDGPKELVYLSNRTTQDVNLDGWTVLNRTGDTQALRGVLRALSSNAFPVPDCPLSNKGGTITLVDAGGLKVDGVGYTKKQAAREGRLVYFH